MLSGSIVWQIQRRLAVKILAYHHTAAASRAQSRLGASHSSVLDPADVREPTPVYRRRLPGVPSVDGSVASPSRTV